MYIAHFRERSIVPCLGRSKFARLVSRRKTTLITIHIGETRPPGLSCAGCPKFMGNILGTGRLDPTKKGQVYSYKIREQAQPTTSVWRPRQKLLSGRGSVFPSCVPFLRCRRKSALLPASIQPSGAAQGSRVERKPARSKPSPRRRHGISRQRWRQRQQWKGMAKRRFRWSRFLSRGEQPRRRRERRWRWWWRWGGWAEGPSSAERAAR